MTGKEKQHRVTTLLVTLHQDGKVTCKLCGGTWRLTKEHKHRKCTLCGRTVFPPPINPYKCHPSCWKGLCRYLTLDWLVCRSSWKAVPVASGISWQTHEAVPTNTHDLMLNFKVGKWAAMMFWQSALKYKWVVRVREIVKPPPEIHEQKYKAYFYNRDKKWRKPVWRARRPTFIQFYPTAAALDVFRSRFPEHFTRDKNATGLVWNPVWTDVSNVVVKPKIKIVPWSKEEKAAYVRKLSGVDVDKRMGQNRLYDKPWRPLQPPDATGMGTL